jgi:hypothetical protein
MVFAQVDGHLFDVFVHLAATPITDVKGFTQVENLLVENAAVHTGDDRRLSAVVAFDFDHHMPNHIQRAVAVIGMLVPAKKYRIVNEAPPVHLQGLASLFLSNARILTISQSGSSKRLLGRRWSYSSRPRIR